MKIQLLYQNKLNQPEYLSAIAEYTKRITPFAQLRVIPADAYTGSDRDIYIQIQNYGDTICSEQLADRLHTYMMSGCQTVTFSLVPLAVMPHDTFCLSGMKLSEPLSLTVLCEQLYRGFMILNHRTYHK